jgi:type IV pilus assembly protein PilQ
MTGGPTPKEPEVDRDAISAEEVAQARAAAEEAKADAQKARAQAIAAKTDADAARGEADLARSQASQARTEAEAARLLAQKAGAEATAAREKRDQAAAEADGAKRKLADAMALLEETKKTSVDNGKDAARARQEATRAQSDLVKAQAQLAQAEAVAGRTLAEAERAAREKVTRIAKEAETARALAHSEQARREKVEATLDSLRAQLDDARRAQEAAQSIKDAAMASAESLRRDAKGFEQTADEARHQADAALEAQRTAAASFEKASKEKREETASVLRQKERETVEAKRRVFEAEKALAAIEAKHGKAIKDLAEATATAKKAADRQQRVEARAELGLAIAKTQRAEAEKAMTAAQARAEKAASAQRAVEKEMEQLRAGFALERQKEQRLAQEKVREAEKRVEAALEASKEALDRLTDSERRIAQAEKEALEAKTRSKAAQREIEIALKDARRAEAVAETTRTELEAARAQIADREKKAAFATARLEDANGRIATQQTRIAELEAGASSAQKEIASAQREAASAQKAAQAEKSAREEMVAKAAAKEAEAAAMEARAVAMEAKATAAAEARAKAEVKASESAPVVAGKKADGKLTQEEQRLLRLARMHGDSGQAAEPVVAAVEPRKQPQDGASKITNIEFVNKGHEQKVVITLDGPASFEKTSHGNKRATLVFDGAKLGPMLERTLDVTDFGGAVERISSYREGDRVKVDVECGAVANNTVSRDGKTIEWVWSSGKRKQDGKVQPLGADARTVMREDESAYEYPMDRTAAYSVNLKRSEGKKKGFTGRRIDLDFKDADIHNILRLLSDVGQVNIVTADDVGGTVTIRMRNVPWDQALDVILQAKKLGMVREGNLIRVAPLATLEKEREMEIARRRQSKALEPLETRLIPVSYAQASELQPRAMDLLSDRGKLSVDTRTNVIIARDTVSNLDQVEALIRNLDTQTPQVLIEGRIVEASSTYAREIGIQWGGDFSASSATANPTGLAFPSTVGVAGGATDNQAPLAGLSPVAGGKPNPNFAVNLPAAAGTGSGGALGITLGSIANNANLNLRLSAMEEEGTLRILSSPKILTLDNREAHIEQGTLIPYSRISAQGVQTAFKEAKLNLTVTPHVTADGSVLMNIKMTRDEPDFNNKGARGDPSILKREAQTELLVADGHTAVIGGIFTRNHGTSYKKVPFFGDIPILGWLFKNRSDSDRRSEMLIFITPRIVNRAESIGQ